MTKVANVRSFQVAIYSDNSSRPGNLVTSSATGTLIANSWNTLAVAATLIANTSYWLMYNTNGLSSGVNNMRMDNGDQGAWSNSSTSFGAWPSVFGLSTLALQNWSIYQAIKSGLTSLSSKL